MDQKDPLSRQKVTLILLAILLESVDREDFQLEDGASVLSRALPLETWLKNLFEIIFIQPAGNPWQLWRLDASAAALPLTGWI